MRPGEGDFGFAGVSQLLGIGGTEIKHHAGDLVLHSEETDVFRTHDRFEVFDMSGAEGTDGNGAQAIGKYGVVEEHWCDLSLADGDQGHAVLRETVSNRDAFGGAADGGDDLIANLIGVGSECEAHGDLFRDNVALGAAVDHADGEDGGLLRIDLAGNDGLREDDELCCHQDGVFAVLRSGAMGADAAHDDIDAGGTGLLRAAFDGDGSCRVSGGVVLGKDEVGAAEAQVEVIGEHGARAVNGLLRGLADEHDGAVPLRFAVGEFAGCSEEDGHVDVVTAGVHDADILALSVDGADSRGVVEAGLFFDGERVHVGANEETRAGAVLEHSNDAECLGSIFVFADAFGDGIAEFAKFAGEEGGGLLFVVRELGIAVEVLVCFSEGGKLAVDGGGEVGIGLRSDRDCSRGEGGKHGETHVHGLGAPGCC